MKTRFPYSKSCPKQLIPQTCLAVENGRFELLKASVTRLKGLVKMTPAHVKLCVLSFP